jgi:hypothetical protein
MGLTSPFCCILSFNCGGCVSSNDKVRILFPKALACVGRGWGNGGTASTAGAAISGPVDVVIIASPLLCLSSPSFPLTEHPKCPGHPQCPPPAPP